MKIIQLCTDLRVGGLQRFVLDLSQELGQRHEVILATHWSKRIDEISVDHPRFRRVSFGKETGGTSLSLMYSINRFLWQEKPDIVHTHLFSLFYAAPMMMLALPRKTRFFHTIHSMADKEMPNLDWLRGRAYRGKTQAVAISEQVKESVREYFPGLEVPLIFNGTEINNESEPDLESKLMALRKTLQTKIFLNIGHLSTTKNQLLLNEAARLLEREGLDFQVAIVGRPDDEEYSKRFFAEKCASIHYLGPSRHPQALLRRADFFTLSSQYEGMPISLIEALGNGCVPVCVPAGGIPSGCIHHENGILADKCTPEALFQAMREAVLLPPEQYAEYRNKSLQLFATRFSIQQCAEKYERLYAGDFSR
jgi:glycosyltransferase involved in cell wall biosynthesis